MSDSPKLCDVLLAKRFEHKHTQEQAAELLDISTRYYQDLEHGRSLPGFKSVCKLAKVYGIDFAQFAEDEKNII